MSYHMNVQQRHIYRVYSLRSFTAISLVTIDYIYGILLRGSKCTYCNVVDTLRHYFAECQVVKGFWESVKRWVLRVFQLVIIFTPLYILLGIPNYDNNNVIMNLNFAILFAKYFIYDCKKNYEPVDFYNFQVKLKTRMVIEEYSRSVLSIILSCIWGEFLLLCVCFPYIFTKHLMYFMCFVCWA